MSGEQVENTPVATSPSPKDTGVRVPRWLIATVGIGVVALVVSGFLHVVYGGRVGFQVCAKDGWYLGDTLVDIEDFTGKPLLANLDRARVLRAMFQCEILKRPNFKRPNSDR